MKLNNILNKLSALRNDKFLTLSNIDTFFIVSLFSVTLLLTSFLNAEEFGIIWLLATFAILLIMTYGFSKIYYKKINSYLSQAQEALSEAQMSQEYSVPHLYCLFSQAFHGGPLSHQNQIIDKLIFLNQLENKNYNIIKNRSIFQEIMCDEEDIKNILSDKRLSLNFICNNINLHMGIIKDNLHLVEIDCERLKAYSGRADKLIPLLKHTTPTPLDSDMIAILQKKIGLEEAYNIIHRTPYSSHSSASHEKYVSLNATQRLI